GAEASHGNAEIERSNKHRAAKTHDAQEPERGAAIGSDEKRSGNSNEGSGSHPKRNSVEQGKRHFARPNLQRQNKITEAAFRRGGENEKYHQRAVQKRNRGVAIRMGRSGGNLMRQLQ